MGWRAQQHYEDAERERKREWIAQLSTQERIRFRFWQVCGLGIVVCAVLLIFAVAINTRAAPIEGRAIEVIDGDTVRADGQIYRLVGFDTPEPGMQAQCESERALAARATFRLRQLITAGGLDLQRVPCACPTGTEGTRRCNYGRLCAKLTAAGRDVGEILVREGLAHEYICVGTRCPRRQHWC